MTLAWESTGEGAPLLLVRPLGGSMALWGAFRTTLARSFRVIAFDPRGVGRSPAGARIVSTRSLAEDAVSVLDEASVARAHVFGISLGGMVATWIAGTHAGRVDGLVLASTMPWGLSARHAQPARAASLGGCLARPGPECDACLARRVLSKRFRREHPDRVRAIEEHVRSVPTSRAVLLGYLAAAARHDAKPLLPRIRARTLVLAGVRDALASPRSQRWMAEALPNAIYEEIDAGHDLTLERPVETAERVARFLGA